MRITAEIGAAWNIVKKHYYQFRYGISIDNVRIEASSLCQLRCPGCNRVCDGQKESFADVIGSGSLSFDNFKKLVDDNPWIRYIELSSWGELFMNPEICKIMEYAYNKKVRLSAGNGVNLNTLSDETAESLGKFKFYWISVSIDGASDETYRIYRRGGDFTRVIENIKKINYYKKKYGSQLPELGWQFIVFGHNEHEIGKAKKMALELNMKFRAKLNSSISYSSPIKDKEYVMKETGIDKVYIEEYETKHLTSSLAACHQLWRSPQINWDGKLLGCCMNTYGDFGNVFKDGLLKCLKSDNYRYAKGMVLGNLPINDKIPCSKCDCLMHIKKNKPLLGNK